MKASPFSTLLTIPDYRPYCPSHLIPKWTWTKKGSSALRRFKWYDNLDHSWPPTYALLTVPLQADLGNARRELITTADNDSNFSQIGLEELDAGRQSNIPGTKAFELAKANKAFLDKWQSS